ncbi:hypothetical protein Tco_1347226 [Tanacetum coccineum]
MATMPSWQSKGIFDPRDEREYKEIKGQDIFYNTFSGYPHEVVKKMPKRDLAEEPCSSSSTALLSAMAKAQLESVPTDNCQSLSYKANCMNTNTEASNFCSSTKNTGVSKKKGKGCVANYTSHSVVEVK